MSMVPKGLLAAAVLAFVLAIICALAGLRILATTAEGFSNAATNLALLAIAWQLVCTKCQTAE